MSARQDADLDGDLAYIFEAAAVHAHTLFDDPLADAVLELFVEELAQDVGVVGESLPELGDHLFAQLVGARLASGFVSTEGGAVEAEGQVLAYDLGDLGRVYGRRVLALRLADLALQLELAGADLADRQARHVQGLEHRLLADALD